MENEKENSIFFFQSESLHSSRYLVLVRALPYLLFLE